MHLPPVIPFEPILTEIFPTGDQWTAQVKWDGVRILTYSDGKTVRLYNRKLNERTAQYPELVDLKSYCSATSVILDGEVIALSNGRPSFHQVMKRDGARLPTSIERACRDVPITHMLFDVLYCDGEWVTDRPLSARQQILVDVITPLESVQLVENFSDPDGLFSAVQSQGMEGIVCKDLNSSYLIKGKDKRWQKIKNYRDLTAVLGGVTFSGNTVNSVLLGLYDAEGKLWYIGHAGTGRLSGADWRALTERVRPLVVSRRPFVNQPGRIKNAVWIRPEITARIQFAAWTAENNLRQPSIQAFVDTPSQDCVFE